MVFGYLVRSLPCIWITALQKLIYVIMLIQYLLFFPDWPAGYWVWPASTVLLLFQYAFLPISMWKRIIFLPVLNMLENVLWHCPFIKSLAVVVSGGQVPKGLPYLHLSLWLCRDIWYTDMGSLPHSVRQWQGQLKHLHQRSTSNVGKNGKVGILEMVYQTMPYVP